MEWKLPSVNLRSCLLFIYNIPTGPLINSQIDKRSYRASYQFPKIPEQKQHQLPVLEQLLKVLLQHKVILLLQGLQET